MDLQRRRVLDGADLAVPRGSVICLAGANGAGKTTLLRVAAGILAPREGRIRMGDLELPRDRQEYSRRVGFLPAGNAGLYARLTVEQNLRLWAAIAYVPRSRRREAVDAALRAFEIEPLADRRSDRLSLGQRQRVRLALAFVHDPELLLLDEPHNSLDEAGIAVLAAALERVAQSGGAAVWAAPSPDQAALPDHGTARVQDGRVQ